MALQVQLLINIFKKICIDFIDEKIIKYYFNLLILKGRYRREEPTCDEDLTYSESEIPRRSFNRESDCPPKKPTKSCMKSRSKKDENGIEKDLPRKPKLTKEQLKRLLEDEKKDVDLALSLASDAEEVYKKPCPKQQKAKQSIKELVGTKMATKENLSKIIQLREVE